VILRSSETGEPAATGADKINVRPDTQAVWSEATKMTMLKQIDTLMAEA
jgi:hypothetical protein